MSKIEWTEKTWNPVTGCTKISPGCKNCYAERMAKRLKAMGQEKYKNEFRVTMHGERILSEPYSWSKPSMIFVCSMGDLFHKDVSTAFIEQVFEVMRDCNHHTFQVLTKRPERMADYALSHAWPPNIWAGTSVENENTLSRVGYLRKVKGAPVRFLSVEPILQHPSFLLLSGLDWLVVGGESGPNARPAELSWFEWITEKVSPGTRVFVKQLGTVLSKQMSIKGKGNNPDEWPKSIRMRQWPQQIATNGEYQLSLPL